MRIVFLTASLSRKAGGVLDAVRLLAQSLQSQPGLEVEALGVRDEAWKDDHADWAQVPSYATKRVGPASFAYAPELLSRVERSGADVVHAHGLWMYPSVAALRCGRRQRHPRIVSPHGMLDPWALNNSRWKKRVAGWLYENDHLREAACMHALCESEAQSIRAYGLKNPIAVIPNGIDLPILGKAEMPKSERLESDGTASRALSETPKHGNESQLSAFPISAFPKDRKILLFLGRIHPKKGLVNLLKAWAEIQKHRNTEIPTEWVLAIAGWDQGGHQSELLQLCNELGLPVLRTDSTSDSKQKHGSTETQEKQDASVMFLGPQFNEAKQACYRNCDAFILPSFSEGLPMAVLEAWSYSKPVLMTPECNLPEGFTANAAIHIDPNVESIEEGLMTLFRSSNSDLQSTGSRGRTLVAEKFSWPQIARDMRSVYNWILSDGARPTCTQ